MSILNPTVDSGDSTANATPPPAPPPSTPTAQPTPAPATPATPSAALTTQPTIVTPKKRGGLAGIIDEFRDAVAGPAPGKIYTDPDGNEFIKHPDSTGNKWLRIVGTAVRGAAAGAAVGQGPAGAWKGGEAGIQAGDKIAAQRSQQAKNQSEEVKNANLEKFNAIKLKHDLAAQEFQLQRLKIKGTQEDVDFAQKQTDRMMDLVGKQKAFDLGTYKDEADLARVKEQNPNFWKDVYQNNIVVVPELGGDGTRQGIHVFQTTPGEGNEPKRDQKFHMFTPGATPNDPPTLALHTATVPLSDNQIHAYDLAAMTQYQKWQADKGEAELKAAQAREAGGKADVAPSEIQKNKAEANKANADAAQVRAETGPTTAASAGKTGEDYLATLPADHAALVRDIGSGRVAPERIAYLLGRGETKQSKQLMAEVAAAYPDLDTSKLAQYPKAYQDFTSGKTSTALNSGATALIHLHELQQLNTNASHIAHTAAWTAYQNKADTVATELARFYGDSTIPAINNIKATLTSTLPGNREAAIRTQAQSMGDKFDSYEQQWKNAAPSARYQAAMPSVSMNAKQARAALDPEYAKRLQGEQAVRPPNVPADYVHRDGPQGMGWYKP